MEQKYKTATNISLIINILPDIQSPMRPVIVATFLIAFTVQASIMNRVVLSAKGDALCLDGTPGAYYIGEGTGANKNKFVIYFEGGGWCGGTTLANTIQSCYQRSDGSLGSSKSYGATIDVTGSGILSGDAAHNPGFWDWTRVFLKYCDGSGHQGTRTSPLNYKGRDLYFRGQNVTIGQLAAVDTTHKLFTEATDIIVTGGSAGGLAAFLWTNYVADKAKAKVYSVPDSGIFLDAANTRTQTHVYRTQFINLMNISNAEVQTPNPQCHKDNPTQSWRCMFAENIHQYIKVPLFPVEPLYDSWSAPNILGISCLNGSSLASCSQSDRDNLEVYHVSTEAVLNKIVNKTGNGAWAPACANHCYIHYSAWTDTNQFSIPAGSGMTVHQAVRNWYLNTTSPSNAHIDRNPWPSNRGCAGATFKRKLLQNQ